MPLIRLLFLKLGWPPLARSKRQVCLADYEANPSAFAAFSGSSTLVHEEREDLVASSFEIADVQIEGCWRHGGRYWETKVGILSYTSTLRIWAPHGDDAVTDVISRLRLLPDLLIGAVCAPLSCNDEDVRVTVFPKYLASILRVQDLPVPAASDFDVRELSHWSQIALDFVIAGVDRCGTTSLLKNFLDHPQILFSKADEDDFLLAGHNKLLPYKTEVDELNGRWPKLTGDRGVLRGLDESTLFRHARVRHALSRIRNLRVVIIVCDPLSRIEKLFWTQWLCTVGPAQSPQVAKPDACWHNMSIVLEKPQLLADWTIADRVGSLVTLFGSRLRLLHQESLRVSPESAYNGIAEFLGIPKFAPGVRFQRHNSVRGHRTGLCRNASLVRSIQQLLAPEYEGVQHLLTMMGVEIPRELQYRITRCDRPEELVT